MTPTEKSTIAVCDHILLAPQEHIDMEPPKCLLEILGTAIAHLRPIREPGVKWKVTRLKMIAGEFR